MGRESGVGERGKGEREGERGRGRGSIIFLHIVMDIEPPLAKLPAEIEIMEEYEQKWFDHVDGKSISLFSYPFVKWLEDFASIDKTLAELKVKKYMRYQKARPNAGIFYFFDGNLLMVRNKMNKRIWGIPKGKVGVRETYWDAARREFSEEVGMKASGRLLGHLMNGNKVVFFVHATKIAINKDFVSRENAEIKWKKMSKMKGYPEDYSTQAKECYSYYKKTILPLLEEGEPEKKTS